MSSLGTSSNEMPINHIEIPINSNDIEAKPGQDIEENNIENSQMSQWLLAAVLGARNGLISVTLVMVAVEALNEDIKTMLLAGFAGLVAGACSMPVEEFVSVDTMLDTEVAQMKVQYNKQGEVEEDDKILNPFHASIASTIGFSIGAMVPMLSAVFVRDYKIRVVVVVAVAILAWLVYRGVRVVIAKSKTRLRRTWNQSTDWRLDDYSYYFWL
ncbi:vacuolar iron transporter homolog 4 [Cajanus cajan]|uniref:Vacuolar iron transporter n=1 Tax=Cajanus cajan TaxID=3821 RepID=A0A151T2P4_CAJCA|nr:vacuolar iron transporter homolog 4 [Cajanus cajan]KYP61314.1 Nodulin-21 [Cajanus cajan]